MVATLNLPRIGRDSPNPVRRELPKSERERKDLWGDTVLEAVLALRDQLSSRNEQIVAAAANSIIELERTRMRHDQHVSGTHADVAQELPELTLRPVESAILPDDDVAPLTEHVDEIREHMERVVGRPMGAAEAKAYVEAKLDRWQVRANRIHRGEFVKMLGLMNDMPGANGSEFPDPRQC